MVSAKYRIGLDFGTTNSALALAEEGKVRVANISNRKATEKTLPSVLFLDEDRDVFVGQQAIEQYIAYGGGYGRFLQSLKAFLPQATFTDTRIFGKRYELEDLIALILREIKSLGEAEAGERISAVTLGRPVVFSEEPEKDALAQHRLHEAARRAGFEDISFEFEPVAATLAYAEQMQGDKEEVVLMGDFGGGTSDFNVMRLAKGAFSLEEKKKRVLSVGGVYIGGDTFNSRIMWQKVSAHFGRNATYRSMSGQQLDVPLNLQRAVCEWHRLAFLREPGTLQTLKEIRLTTDNPRAIDNLENLIVRNKGFMIFQAIERAKRELSTTQESRIHYEDSSLQIDERITRAEFEESISKDLDAISACVADTMARAKVDAKQIDRVLLTGGSSFVPGVRGVFERMFGAEKMIYLDAFTSVAHGLARSASFA